MSVPAPSSFRITFISEIGLFFEGLLPDVGWSRPETLHLDEILRHLDCSAVNLSPSPLCPGSRMDP